MFVNITRKIKCLTQLNSKNDHHFLLLEALVCHQINPDYDLKITKMKNNVILFS